MSKKIVEKNCEKKLSKKIIKKIVEKNCQKKIVKKNLKKKLKKILIFFDLFLFGFHFFEIKNHKKLTIKKYETYNSIWTSIDRVYTFQHYSYLAEDQ